MSKNNLLDGDELYKEVVSNSIKRKNERIMGMTKSFYSSSTNKEVNKRRRGSKR